MVGVFTPCKLVNATNGDFLLQSCLLDLCQHTTEEEESQFKLASTSMPPLCGQVGFYGAFLDFLLFLGQDLLLDLEGAL